MEPSPELESHAQAEVATGVDLAVAGRRSSLGRHVFDSKWTSPARRDHPPRILADASRVRR